MVWGIYLPVCVYVAKEVGNGDGSQPMVDVRYCYDVGYTLPFPP